MSTVAEIKQAIERLSHQERSELAAWFNPIEDDDWDRQMAEDAKPGGKLHCLMLQAQNEMNAGTLRDLSSLEGK